MIIAPVEIQIVLVGEIRNIDRVAAGFHSVRCVRIKRRVNASREHVVRRGQRAFHLVVDNAVHCDRAVRVVRLIMPALLAENVLFLVDIGIEHRVQIHVHQVPEVGVVAAGHGIHGLVRIGHRVQKCIERTLDKLNEGILDRKIPRPAQHRVLDDMCDARRILRRRAESDIKHFIVIITGKKGHSGACLSVS